MHTLKKETMKIQANTKITVYFITDSELRPTINVVERIETPKSIFVKVDIRGEGAVKRKVYNDGTGEYIFPYGKYSMCPVAY